MKQFVYLLTKSARCLLAGAALTAVLAPVEATAQTATTPYYSKFATPTSSEYSTTLNGLVCVGCGVANAERAADNTLANYATVQQSVGAGNRASLRLRLNGVAQPNYRVGVVVGGGGTLNAGALAAIVLRTYSGGTLQETRLANASAVTSNTLADGRTQISFITSRPVDQLDVEATIVANVLNTLNVYYAYAVPANVVENATGYLSRLTAASANDYVATASGGALCLNSAVNNPLNAVTPSLTDAATLHVTGVGCKAALQVKLEGSAPAGYQAGFVIGSSSVLDVNVLSSLKVKTYKDGVLQETGSAANLLDLKLLPDGKYQVSFKSTLPFDRVELEKTGVLGLLDDVQVYYGFGIEPRAFQDQNPIVSDFAAGQTSGTYQTAGNCPNCIQNPERAADASLTNYAQINFPTVSLGGSQILRLRVNGDANAGNRAGVVMSFNNGLLSTSLLSNVTIRTYDAAGNFLESASGTGLLSTGLLGSSAQKIGFMTTQDFEWIEVEINNGIGLGSNAQIYYAFADDPVQGFPTNITPPSALPVELRAFQAKATDTAVELSWETAMEKNSSYFAVERAAVADGHFTEVGRVAAAGNSTSRTRYATRDTEVLRLAAGVLYYRLRQVDTDGSTTYSVVQAVRWQTQGSTALTLYPNPATEAATVQLAAGQPAEGSVICLYTTRGQLVRRQALSPNSTSLVVKGLPAGLYQVVLLDARGQRLANQRLSVVR